MKIRTSWIVAGAALIVTASVAIPKVKAWFPSRDTARIEQSTPQNAAYAMFQAVDQGGGDIADPALLYRNRLDDTHLLNGKDMTEDEQSFSNLFLDARRSGVIYAYLRSKVATQANITQETITADSATLAMKVRILPDRSSDWTLSPCTVDLQKQGPNWYVKDVKFPAVPGGIYTTFKQQAASMTQDASQQLHNSH
ncbi:MAG TPA: hypothetical protein VN661_02615 [Candidatus Acidoferrales bacterium]|nr:hypothetical protein [Candidatus Acidoferrales bacterium]